LSITDKVASAGTAIVLAIAIGDPPDLVINTEASAELLPSMFAINMVLILKTFPEAAEFNNISVVRVVSSSA
jgi:hypothetical protein